MHSKIIDANNELIAKFMESDSRPRQYDYSWNWLMSVVEKIESLEYDDIHYEIQIFGGCCVYIMSNSGEEIICVDNEESKILCVYKAVVEFIKLYNEWKTI